MRHLGADLILAQEVSAAGVPQWLRDDWTLVTGEYGRFRKDWNWGSVIAAKPILGLNWDEHSLADQWLTQLYDLVVVGQIRLGSDPVIVASVHTAALPVGKWLRDHAKSLIVSDTDMRNLRRPECNEPPFLNDMAFMALARIIDNRRFLVAGDWNTCRKYPGGQQFFARAKSQGWVECHRQPEEQSFFLPKATRVHSHCDVSNVTAHRSRIAASRAASSENRR
jgi:hypothetical protein